MEKLTALEQRKAAKLMKREQLREGQLQRHLLREQEVSGKTTCRQIGAKRQMQLFEQVKHRYPQMLNLQLPILEVNPASKLKNNKKGLKRVAELGTQTKPTFERAKSQESERKVSRTRLPKRLVRESTLTQIDELQTK
jgi:hypothetical protein